MNPVPAVLQLGKGSGALYKSSGGFTRLWASPDEKETQAESQRTFPMKGKKSLIPSLTENEAVVK